MQIVFLNIVGGRLNFYRHLKRLWNNTEENTEIHRMTPDDSFIFRSRMEWFTKERNLKGIIKEKKKFLVA